MRDHAPLDAGEIVRGLAGAGVPWSPLCLEECDSTNREALARAGADPELAERGLAVFAGWQSAGRGRRGARWRSEPEADLLLSVALQPALPIELWSRLTHATALAVCKCLEREFKPTVKWPNDIYLSASKVAGILVESEPTTRLAVIGIGLNVNSDPAELGDGLAAPATSLRMEAGSTIDRTALAIDLLRELHLALAAAGDRFLVLLEELRDRSALLGRAVSLTLPDDQPLSGHAADFASEGELLLRLPSGTTRRIANASQVRLV